MNNETRLRDEIRQELCDYCHEVHDVIFCPEYCGDHQYEELRSEDSEET